LVSIGQIEKVILLAAIVLDDHMINEKDYKKVQSALKHNLKMIDMAKDVTDTEYELILLVVIYELRELTSEIIKEWQLADS